MPVTAGFFLVLLVHAVGGARLASRMQAVIGVSSWQCPITARPKLLVAPPATQQVGSFHMLAGQEEGTVHSVDASTLQQMADNGNDFIVTFYAPWCTYSQMFVLNGGAKAPIEKLNMVLAKLKGPKVVKYNIDQHRKPAGYSFEGIPTIMMVSNNGSNKVEYTANPLLLEDLAAFAMTRGGIQKFEKASLVALFNATQPQQKDGLQNGTRPQLNMNHSFPVP